MLSRPFLYAVLLCCLSVLPVAGEDNRLTPAEVEAGWHLLFDGSTPKGWHRFHGDSFPEKGWVVEDGWLHGLGKGGGDLVSEGLFDQFELQWEWKISQGGNSGLKYFVLDNRSTALGHEYQMLDDEHNGDASAAGGKRVTAAFYDVLKLDTKPPLQAAGQINVSKVLVRGDHVEHWLNGVKVLEYECGSDRVQKAVAESKFKTTPGFGRRAKGHLLLQDHGSEVWFRNIKVRDLSKS